MTGSPDEGGPVQVDERYECPRCGNNRAYCICEPLPLSTYGDDNPSVGASYRATCLADVEPERVRWLWVGRLAVGKLACSTATPVSPSRRSPSTSPPG